MLFINIRFFVFNEKKIVDFQKSKINILKIQLKISGKIVFRK